jgi:pilus assembly protein CpaF
MFGTRSENTKPDFGSEATVTSQVIPLRPAPASAAPAETAPISRDALIDKVIVLARPVLRARFSNDEVASMPRGELAGAAEDVVINLAEENQLGLASDVARDAVTFLINDMMAVAKGEDEIDHAPEIANPVDAAKDIVAPVLLERIDVALANQMSRADLSVQISEIVAEILGEEKVQLNKSEQRDLVTSLLNDMLGLGPLEPLLADAAVNDIMVNGAKQVYVERNGKLELTDVTFRDNAHVMNIAQRIVSAVGRRIDETSPLVDARLADGSRVNIIIPPLAIDGPTISIRKFSEKKSPWTSCRPRAICPKPWPARSK